MDFDLRMADLETEGKVKDGGCEVQMPVIEYLLIVEEAEQNQWRKQYQSTMPL